MLRRTLKTLTLILLLLLMVSCEKAGLGISEVQASSFTSTEGEEGFYFYVGFDENQKLSCTVTVTSPSGNLKWECPMNETVVAKKKYYGSSDFSMPLGLELESGIYSYQILRSDGEATSGSFEL